MHAFQRKSLPAVLLLSLGGIGCDLLDEKDTRAPTNVRVTGGVTEGESVTGQRTLQATAEDDSGKVSRMEFSVSGRPVCMDSAAKSSGQTFSCTWDPSTEAQGSYQLTAKAFDAAGNATTSAPISFTIPVPNLLPTITLLTATPTSLDEGASTSLSVTASDPDGDVLTYSWTQLPASPTGTFSDAAGATPTWTAPFLSSNTTFALQVTVTDAGGGSTSATVDVAVANVPALNNAPTVDAAITVSSTSVIAGETVNLSIGATDPDGDPLTYAWTTSVAGQGTFTNATASATQWRSPDISAATTYTFELTVSDGTDSVTRTVDVQVAVPEYARDIQPLWDSLCTSCHSSAGRGGLNLLAGSSHASLVNTPAAGAPCGPSSGVVRTRVVPGNPDESLLVSKISPTPVCGDRMPQLDVAHFDNNPGQITRIRSWILAGAQNN